MNPEAEAHLTRIQAEAARRIDAKYRHGQTEHGGYLPDMGTSRLLDEAICEAVDMVVYLLTLRDLMPAPLDGAAYEYDWSNGRPVPVTLGGKTHMDSRQNGACEGNRSDGVCHCHVRRSHDHGAEGEDCRLCREAE